LKGLFKKKQINYLKKELDKMIKLLKKIDKFIYKHWNRTANAIMRLFGTKQEDDIDWLNMHNYIQSKKDKD